MAIKRTFTTMSQCDNSPITVQYHLKAPSLYKLKEMARNQKLSSMKQFRFSLQSDSISLDNPKPYKRRKLYHSHSTTKKQYKSTKAPPSPPECTPIAEYQTPILHHCQIIERYNMLKSAITKKTTNKANKPTKHTILSMLDSLNTPRPDSDDDQSVSSSSHSDLVSRTLQMTSESDTDSIGSWYTNYHSDSSHLSANLEIPAFSINDTQRTATGVTGSVSDYNSGFNSDPSLYPNSRPLKGYQSINGVRTTKSSQISKSSISSHGLAPNGGVHGISCAASYPQGYGVEISGGLAADYKSNILSNPCGGNNGVDEQRNPYTIWVRMGLFALMMYLGVRYGNISDLVGSGANYALCDGLGVMCKDKHNPFHGQSSQMEQGKDESSWMDWLLLIGIISVVMYMMRRVCGNGKGLVVDRGEMAHGDVARVRYGAHCNMTRNNQYR